MNHLLEYRQLANSYYVMRHGHSQANQQRIIVSHPENGYANFGLTELGDSQVRQALEQNHQLDSAVRIVCSDFKRARDTAKIVCQRLRCTSPIQMELRLRERNFGNLELGSDAAYGDVWREDAIDADRQLNGIESANQVMSRVSGLIVELERNYSSTCFLLISHGDALQLLQSAFLKQPAARHRELQHLETAEIRQLELA